MIRVFKNNKFQPIYSPDEFEMFCVRNGATKNFDNPVTSVSSSKQREQRQTTNKKSIAAVLYYL